jgi:hypothetical protein
MRRLLLGIGFAVGGLGCGASQAREAPDPMHDPAWIPPGQGDLDVADAPEVKPSKPRPRTPKALPKPNQHENGTLRVATDRR